MRTIKAECVLRAGAVLAEGPVWDGLRQRLWWVDIERNELHSFDPGNGTDCGWTLDHRIGFAVPSTRGDLVIGTQRGLMRFDPDAGIATAVVDPESHLPDNRFNDAKCDPAGRLWAGTMAVSESPCLGSLYRVDKSWQVDRMVTNISISNGLAWSTDGRTMYYIDSPTRRVDAFDFDPHTGDISNRRAVIEVVDGFPDGMCIDANGNLWVALWGGWGVACYDPRTGAQIDKIEIAVEAVTSCCFAGADLDELYTTTASRDLDPRGRAEQPLAGCLFRARPGGKGLPTPFFAG
jgi:sugar lactone lactonase YvrE